METPSSMRRLTRSQTSLLASQKSKQEDSVSRSRPGGKTALVDITNDSPIVGLATGGAVDKTPLSSAAKDRVRAVRTPGSGEALLRGQVKTLLQKVEEETLLLNKIDRPPFGALMGFTVSPAQLLAPTPANTPLLQNLCYAKEEDVGSAASAVGPEIPAHQIDEALKEEEEGEEQCMINRALLFDSPGKISEMSSSLTYQGSEAGNLQKSPEDDNSSAWSLQVNACSIKEDDDDEEEDLEEEVSGPVDDEEEEKEDDGDECFDDDEEEDLEEEVSGPADDEEEEKEDDGDECFDDLCEGLMKMTVQDESRRLPEFAGKHTRFIYNSDGEMEGEEEVGKKLVSPSAMLLKGLPAPEGKHLRFQDEDD